MYNSCSGWMLPGIFGEWGGLALAACCLGVHIWDVVYPLFPLMCDFYFFCQTCVYNCGRIWWMNMIPHNLPEYQCLLKTSSWSIKFDMFSEIDTWVCLYIVCAQSWCGHIIYVIMHIHGSHSQSAVLKHIAVQSCRYSPNIVGLLYSQLLFARPACAAKNRVTSLLNSPKCPRMSAGFAPFIQGCRSVAFLFSLCCLICFSYGFMYILVIGVIHCNLI